MALCIILGFLYTVRYFYTHRFAISAGKKQKLDEAGGVERLQQS